VTAGTVERRSFRRQMLEDFTAEEFLKSWRAMDAAERAQTIDKLRVEPDEDILRAIIAPREKAT
jgi:hypothetical protein